MTPANPAAARLLETFSAGDAFVRMTYQGAAHILPVALREDVLWGARGTGKSSLSRAALLHYRARGLKSLQIACDDLADLPFLLWTLAHSPAPYLIYIDDLSFSAGDGSYRALKAVLDGALGGIAPNLLLCLTSNRRHLLAEYHRDDRALHPQEDEEEQVSLAERFGLRLAFHPLDQEQYLATVAHWLGRPLDSVTRQKALQYALAHGSRSARVAAQCAKHLR